MGRPSGGRGPSRARDRSSTIEGGAGGGRAGGEGRGGEGRGGRGAGGRGGGVGPGVLNSENNGSIHSQPSLIGRLI